MKGGHMTTNRKFLFLAIKPEFAKKIIDKEKTIELRKQRPNVHIGDYVIIYASSPIKSVLGYGKVKSIIVCTPEEMWKFHKKQLGIDKLRFYAYYDGHGKSVGIEIERIKSISALTLKELQSIDSTFRPPQGFRYVSNEQISKAIEKYICNNG